MGLSRGPDITCHDVAESSPHFLCPLKISTQSSLEKFLQLRERCDSAVNELPIIQRLSRFVYPHDIAVAPFAVYFFGLDVFPRTMASLRIATVRWKTTTRRSVGDQCILISLTPGGKKCRRSKFPFCSLCNRPHPLKLAPIPVCSTLIPPSDENPFHRRIPPIYLARL